MMRYLPLYLSLAAPACLSDKPGGEVGSETHFLSACLSNEDCGAGGLCACGVCTATCVDDCALGACAAGDSAAVVSWCASTLATGLCLEPCLGDRDCDEGACREGYCGAGLLPAGARCEASGQCADGECNLGFCGSACMIPDHLCPDDMYCMVPGAASGVCLPGVLEAFPAALAGGDIALGESRELLLEVANSLPGPVTLTRISVETRVSGEAPTEVSVLEVPPISIGGEGLVPLTVRLTPATAGARPYRLTIRLRESVVPLIVNVDFVGVRP